MVKRGKECLSDIDDVLNGQQASGRVIQKQTNNKRMKRKKNIVNREFVCEYVVLVNIIYLLLSL